MSPNFNTVLVGTLPISEQKMSSSRLACTSDDSCNKKRIIHDYMHVATQVHRIMSKSTTDGDKHNRFSCSYSFIENCNP